MGFIRSRLVPGYGGLKSLLLLDLQGETKGRLFGSGTARSHARNSALSPWLFKRDGFRGMNGPAGGSLPYSGGCFAPPRPPRELPRAFPNSTSEFRWQGGRGRTILVA